MEFLSRHTYVFHYYVLYIILRKQILPQTLNQFFSRINAAGLPKCLRGGGLKRPDPKIPDICIKRFGNPCFLSIHSIYNVVRLSSKRRKTTFLTKISQN